MSPADGTGHLPWPARVHTYSWWSSSLMSYGLVIPGVVAIGPVLNDPALIPAGLIGMIGAFGVSRYSSRDHWSLDRASRRTVYEVVRTGRPSGDVPLDEFALDRLRRHSEESARTTRLFLLISGLVLIALPVVAALRSVDWWLIACVPGTLFVVIYTSLIPAESAGIRRGRLETALAP